jgi:hypothetical protein
MKRLLGLLVLVLSASPALAQDVDFGAFDDLPPPPAASAPRGAPATAARGAVTPPPPPDRLVRLREVLLKAEAPLTKEQETALNALMAAEIPIMRQTIKTHGQQMMAARPPAAPPAPGAAVPPPATPPPAAPPAVPPAAAAARGGTAGAPNPAMLAALAAARGASPSTRVPADILDALEVEMRQMNDALFTKIASAPALDARQQGVLTKMARDQMKSRGGYDALRISMEDAKAPFSEEQIPRVQAVFEDQKKARAELVKESGGAPDEAKLKALERESQLRLVGILTQAQRSALLALLKATQ